MSQQVGRSEELALRNRSLSPEEKKEIELAIENAVWDQNASGDVTICHASFTLDDRYIVAMARMGYLTSPDKQLFLVVSHNNKGKTKVLQLTLEIQQEDVPTARHRRQYTLKEAQSIVSTLLIRIKGIKGLVKS